LIERISVINIASYRVAHHRESWYHARASSHRELIAHHTMIDDRAQGMIDMILIAFCALRASPCHDMMIA